MHNAYIFDLKTVTESFTRGKLGSSIKIFLSASIRGHVKNCCKLQIGDYIRLQKWYFKRLFRYVINHSSMIVYIILLQTTLRAALLRHSSLHSTRVVDELKENPPLFIQIIYRKQLSLSSLPDDDMKKPCRYDGRSVMRFVDFCRGTRHM